MKAVANSQNELAPLLEFLQGIGQIAAHLIAENAPRPKIVAVAKAAGEAENLKLGKPPRFAGEATGMPAGLSAGNEVRCTSTDMGVGEVLVMYTDGVTEAMNSAQDLFGEEGLMAHLSREPAQSAAETTAGVLEAVHRHAAGARQSDDITVVAVRRTP